MGAAKPATVLGSRHPQLSRGRSIQSPSPGPLSGVAVPAGRGAVPPAFRVPEPVCGGTRAGVPPQRGQRCQRDEPEHHSLGSGPVGEDSTQELPRVEGHGHLFIAVEGRAFTV